MILAEALDEVKTIFLDTAPVIYFIEAHDQNQGNQDPCPERLSQRYQDLGPHIKIKNLSPPHIQTLR